MFWKKDEANAPLEKAKAMVKILLRAVIRNNPQYQAAITVFCDVVGSGPNDALMGLIEKELGKMDGQMLAKDRSRSRQRPDHFRHLECRFFPACGEAGAAFNR